MDDLTAILAAMMAKMDENSRIINEKLNENSRTIDEKLSEKFTITQEL